MMLLILLILFRIQMQAYEHQSKQPVIFCLLAPSGKSLEMCSRLRLRMKGVPAAGWQGAGSGARGDHLFVTTGRAGPQSHAGAIIPGSFGQGDQSRLTSNLKKKHLQPPVTPSALCGYREHCAGKGMPRP